MNAWQDEPARRCEPDLTQRLQESLGGLLFRTLTGKYAMPPGEAAVMLRVLLLSTRDAPVEYPEAWLVTATCNSARDWLRLRARDDGTPVSLTDEADDIRALSNKVFFAKALALLSEDARVALRLRYQYRQSFEEIGAEMGLTTRYAEIVVRRSLARLRELQKGQP